MPRIARLINREEKTAYHLMSRTALDGFPFGDIEKDELVKIIKKFSKLFFVDVFGYCIMSNHFHILGQIYPETYFSDEEILKRCKAHYGEDFILSEEQMSFYREKLSSLSDYMKEIKQSFSRYYNKLHNRRGTLWGERYKSLIVENGETLVNCLAYIDLNPVRAGIVEKPEAYRWCSLGYHVQANNKDDFLSLDFGLMEFGVKDESERLRLYRDFVYEKGHTKQKGRRGDEVTGRRDTTEGETRGMGAGEKREGIRTGKGFEISAIEKFKYRSRYFSDSGIIGTKAFVARHYQTFKHHFSSKHEKRPKTIRGLDGIYSLKRLSEKM